MNFHEEEISHEPVSVEQPHYENVVDEIGYNNKLIEAENKICKDLISSMIKGYEEDKKIITDPTVSKYIDARITMMENMLESILGGN